MGPARDRFQRLCNAFGHQTRTRRTVLGKKFLSTLLRVSSQLSALTVTGHVDEGLDFFAHNASGIRQITSGVLNPVKYNC